MKHSTLILLAASCLLVSCNRYQRFSINGTLEDAGFRTQSDSIRIECEYLDQTIQAPVVDGAFSIKGKVKQAGVAKISQVNVRRRHAYMMILEKGKITFQDGHAAGTPLNDTTAAFVNHLTEVQQALTDRNAEFDERKAVFEKEFSSFVTRHKGDPCSVIAILLSRRNVEDEFLLSLIKTTTPAIQNYGEIHALKAELEAKTRAKAQ